MQPEPSVSVIIPTYNRSNLISAALESVLNQSFKNFEIIVVDDGSTDDTSNILERFKDKTRYFVTENKGPAHARNVGMKAANGKYIAFLDSDDAYLPHKLELQVAFMEAHPEVGLVCTEVTGFNDSGIIEEYHLRSFHQIYKRNNWSYEDVFPVRGEMAFSTLGHTVSYFIGDIFRYMLQGPVVMSNTIMVKREILEQVGYQNEAYHLAEEYELIVRICKYYKVGFINYPTYLYRYHGHQISEANQAWTKERALIWIGVEKVFLQAVLDWGVGDKEYYKQNCDWLNKRLAELYHVIGEKWLEYGENKEARNCFRKGLSYEPSCFKNCQCFYISFLPSICRRLVFGLSRRIKRWAC